MLTLPASTRIYLCSASCDMRRGFDGLLGEVRRRCAEEPFAGHLSIFIGKRKHHLKVLFWQAGGLRLFAKRLEIGCVKLPARLRCSCRPRTWRCCSTASICAMCVAISFASPQDHLQIGDRQRRQGRIERAAMIDLAPEHTCRYREESVALQARVTDQEARPAHLEGQLKVLKCQLFDKK